MPAWPLTLEAAAAAAHSAGSGGPLARQAGGVGLRVGSFSQQADPNAAPSRLLLPHSHPVYLHWLACADTVDDSGMPLARGPKVAKGGLGDRLRRGGYNFEITVRILARIRAEAVHACSCSPQVSVLVAGPRPG